MAIKVEQVRRNVRLNQAPRRIKSNRVVRQINVQSSTRNISTGKNSRIVRVNQSPKEINFRRLEHVIQVNQVGRRGPQGEQGPPGSDAEDKNYLQDFTNSSVVNVTHNLSKYPAVTIIDSSGDEIEAEVEHTSTSQLIARFSASLSGRLICN